MPHNPKDAAAPTPDLDPLACPDPDTGECLTAEECFPTTAQVLERGEEWFLLGCPERPGEGSDEPLRDVFLQRLRLPMEVYSARARRWITLPSLHLIYRWAAREFYQYEVGRL